MKTASYIDVTDLGELPKLKSSKRYFEFIGGSKEFRCFECDVNTPRSLFMKENSHLIDEALRPIYENNGIVVNQDVSYALPGFYIVGLKKHINSMDQVDELTHQRLFFIIREIRKGMRERLGIDYVHIYYEERAVISCNVHYWILPIIDIEKHPRLYKFDIEAYLKQFHSSVNMSKIQKFNELLKKYIDDSKLKEQDNDLTRRLLALPKNCKTPKTVDFNVNGACNLDCAWCWGPDHKASESLSIEDWKKIALNLKLLGTTNITFTGGEPFLKKGLSELLEYVHEELQLRVTVSTNGLLMKRFGESLLPFVDDLGLPLDGHNQAINNLMRKGTPKHFHCVLEAILFVQSMYPHIDLTLRSVVSNKNLDSVPLIGKTLLDYGVNPKKIRWKLYQLTPVGIRKDDIVGKGWEVTKEEFDEVTENVKERNPEFSRIGYLNVDMHVGRYFHIYPDGNSHVFVDGEDKLPQFSALGNIKDNFNDVIEKLSNFDLNLNKIR